MNSELRSFVPLNATLVHMPDDAQNAARQVLLYRGAGSVLRIWKSGPLFLNLVVY